VEKKEIAAGRFLTADKAALSRAECLKEADFWPRRAEEGGF
jgi:hypothetical protein